MFKLAANPGEYEFKVLWNNKLARSIKFTVGPDGKLTTEFHRRTNWVRAASSCPLLSSAIRMGPGIARRGRLKLSTATR